MWRNPACTRPTGAVGDQEDEEAFLEGITNTAGMQLPQLAVKVKLQSSPAWSPAVLLKPGHHQAGLQTHPAHLSMALFAVSAVMLYVQQLWFLSSLVHVCICSVLGPGNCPWQIAPCPVIKSMRFAILLTNQQ